MMDLGLRDITQAKHGMDPAAVYDAAVESHSNRERHRSRGGWETSAPGFRSWGFLGVPVGLTPLDCPEHIRIVDQISLDRQ